MNTLTFNNHSYNYKILGSTYPLTLMIKSNETQGDGASQSLGMLSIDHINKQLTVTGMLNKSVCDSSEDIDKLISLIFTEILKEPTTPQINVQLIPS